MKQANWFYLYGGHFTKPMVLAVFQEKQEAISHLAKTTACIPSFELSNHWVEDKETLKKRFSSEELRKMFTNWK